uniref:Small glutamine rich tetratricopeptide repeat co-chaperone alpha n=1 Tax=Naja naja TaxID=35670 RepID=A0A8C6V8D7_NAJNA
MAEQKRLAFAIIEFLQEQLQHGGLSPDAQESLEVAIQCLETAFGVSVDDRGLAISQKLPDIFEAAAAKEPLQSCPVAQPAPPSEEDAAEAERLKTEGNEQMKVENFKNAVSFYGKAIELNPSNAVYYCNRAAAYSKLGNYAGAVRDCERAISIDPKYSKAYGRMGYVGPSTALGPGRGRAVDPWEGEEEPEASEQEEEKRLLPPGHPLAREPSLHQRPWGALPAPLLPQSVSGFQEGASLGSQWVFSWSGTNPCAKAAV